MPHANSSDVKIYWEDQGEGALGAQASLPASLRTGDDPSHATPGRQGSLRSQGDALLLIMGLGYTMDMWYRTAPVLSQRYRTSALTTAASVAAMCLPGLIRLPRWLRTRRRFWIQRE